MSDTPTGYLAGPVLDAEDNGQSWRDDVKDSYDQFEWLDPLDKYVHSEAIEDDEEWLPEMIVEEDLAMIDEADFLLVRYDGQQTFGTPMEMFYASERNIPVFVVWAADIGLSPWVEHHAQTVRNTMPRAMMDVTHYFDPHATDPEVANVGEYDLESDIEAIQSEADPSEGIDPVDTLAGVGAIPDDTDYSTVCDGCSFDESSTDDGYLGRVEQGVMSFTLDMEEGEVIDTENIPDWLEIVSKDEEDEPIDLPDESPEDILHPTGDELAGQVLENTASLINDDRDTHGDAVQNQEHIAEGWTWYLRGHGLLGPRQSLDGADVARMMVLLKQSRLAVGEYDLDHDRDSAGYAGIAAACESTGDQEREDKILEGTQ